MKGRTIIKAQYLWDGKMNSPLPEGAVLMEDGEIQATGPSREILTAPDANVIDYTGATLLPGLIDSHTHLSMDASAQNYLDRMSDEIPVLTLRAAAMMRKDVLSGVTTCRCLGDKAFLDVACREAVHKNVVTGPRLLVATRGIRAPQGHGFVGYPFKGVDEIRDAVRMNIAMGADLIKIYITGTLKGNGNLPAYLSHDELKVAIDESHRAGRRVAAHCVGGHGLDWALEFGLDTLEHAYHITPKQVDRLANSRTSLVLTPSAVLSEKRVRNLPQALIDGHLKERDQMFSAMQLAVKARIPYAVGTDGMHGDLADDITYLAELGASSAEALQAATVYGAAICGIENKTGSLEAGKHADIIAVKGNPFEDLRALRSVIAVIKKGNFIRNDTAATVRAEQHAYDAK